MPAQSASSAANLTANTFTRTGYTFAGWNTAANGTGTSYANSASYAFTANITIFAQWTADPTTAFSPPTGVAGTAGKGHVVISWTAPSTTGDGTITGYTVSSDPEGRTCNVATVLSCVLTGLRHGTSYRFTVTAFNSAGQSSDSQPSSPIEPLLSVVEGLDAPFVNGYNVNGTVWAAWNRLNMSGVLTGYKMNVSSSETGSPVVGSCTTTGAQSCAVSGLTPGNRYYVVVIPRVGTTYRLATTAPQRTTVLEAGSVRSLLNVPVSPVSQSDTASLSSSGDQPDGDQPDGDEPDGDEPDGDPQCDIGSQFNYEAWSPDGRFLAFNSNSDVLIPNDTNCVWDLFFQDLETGIIRRASESAAGIGGNRGAERGFWSPDGQWLAFWTDSSNLVPGVDDGLRHLYIKRIEDGAIFQVDANNQGVPANGEAGDYGYFAYWSPDSSKIAFIGNGTNFDEHPLGGFFIKDLASGDVIRASEGTNGEQIDNWIGEPNSRGFSSHLQFWSSDGTKVAFFGAASSLVPGDTNNRSDVFVKDLTTGILSRVSVDSSGNQLNGVDCGFQSGWSAVGNRLLYQCGDFYVLDVDTGQRFGPVAGGETTWGPDGRKIGYLVRTTGFNADLRLWDLDTNTTSFVAKSTWWFAPMMSPDGSRIAYVGEVWHMYVSDLSTLAQIQADTTATGVSANGQVNSNPTWSPDSTRLSFESVATNLESVSGDFYYKLFIKVLPT